MNRERESAVLTFTILFWPTFTIHTLWHNEITFLSQYLKGSFSRCSPQYGNAPVLSSSESLQKRSLFGSLGNGAVLCIQRSAWAW